MGVVTRLVALPLIVAVTVVAAAWLLFWVLVGPVLLYLGSRWLLKDGSTASSVVVLISAVWGTFGLWNWWLHVRTMMAALTKKPAQRRRRR